MNPPARSRSTGRVTLNDVAAVAQVSTITASRVLRGLPNVSADLASRVRAAAERLGYVPDPAARALASAHGTQMPLLVPALADPPLAAAAEAAERALRPAGLQTLLACSGGEP
ncbi:MAG: LacI family DNA-binding transcriptional regulator, partial [Betaproteobacteria bacterium]